MVEQVKMQSVVRQTTFFVFIYNQFKSHDVHGTANYFTHNTFGTVTCGVYLQLAVPTVEASCHPIPTTRKPQLGRRVVSLRVGVACAPNLFTASAQLDIAIFIAPVVGVVTKRRRQTSRVRCPWEQRHRSPNAQLSKTCSGQCCVHQLCTIEHSPSGQQNRQIQRASKWMLCAPEFPDIPKIRRASGARWP